MSLFHDVIERVRFLVFRRREERELHDELQFHIEMESDYQQKRGLPPADATRRGRIALGNTETLKEEVRDARGTRLLEDSIKDLRVAIRSLAKNPGFTSVAVLTLALGIGATTAVFSAVDAVLLQPLPYQEPGQLVRLYNHEVGSAEDGFVTPVHYLAYRERLASFESVAATYTYDVSGADIGGSTRPERITLLPASSDYFSVVRVQPVIGRAFMADEEEREAAVVILSDRLWEREFSRDRSAIGRPLVMSGRPYTVIGVMPPGFRDPVVGNFDALVPQDLRPGRIAEQAGNHYLTVLARLDRGATIASAQAELDRLGDVLASEFPNADQTRARLRPLKNDIVGPASRSLEIMLGAVALVLLLVCVNITNLLLVRGSARSREFALRGALGGSRGRLVRQTLIESLALAVAGAIAGLVVARLTMAGIVILGAGSIPRLEQLTLEPRLLAFSMVVASGCAIVFGLVPALRSARTPPGDVLREQGRSATGSASQGRLRTGLVISQIGLAFVLLVGAGLLLASFQRLRDVDLGVSTGNVLTFELALPAARYDAASRARFYEDFAAEVARLPGVRAAGGTSRLPATGTYMTWGTRAASGPLVGTEDGFMRPTPQQRMVSGDYFAAVGLHLLAGRSFGREPAGDFERLVVSKSVADRLFPNLDPIGQRLRTGGRDGEIIGVVPDIAVDAEGVLQPHVYHAHADNAVRLWELTQVIATTGPAAAIEPQVRRTLAALDPQLVMFRPALLDDAIGQGSARRMFTLRMLTTFAGVALALAAVGLFGVMSYAVRLRSREFGIRLALGAERGSIRRMVLRKGLAVVAIGVAAGLCGAVATSRLMASLVFQVSPLDPLVMAGAVLFMFIVAGGAAWLPAYRATAVEPREVLQRE